MSTSESQLLSLIQQSERAWANGQKAEAARLLESARAIAPDDALVLNATGVQEMDRGNVESARKFIQNAIVKDPTQPGFYLNLASILRQQQLRDEEMKALDAALMLAPRHPLALLQKASLLELTGKPRAAATIYRNALQSIPPGTQLPASLRAPLQHAVQAVEQNNAQLDLFLQTRLQAIEAKHPDEDVDRVRQGLDAVLGKRRIYSPQPSFLHVPKLPAWEFYPRAHFGWLDEIEAASAEIRAEFERVLAEDAKDSRRWSEFYFWREGKAVEDHLARCPRTAELIAQAPTLDIDTVGPNVFFSILAAKSHLPPHCGVTNARLTVHIPLVVPPGCRLRVGAETRPWHPGTAFVFDDTIENEAWNDSDAPRAVLIFDIWNPYLSAAERDIVRTAVPAIGEYYGRHSPLAESQ